jgi:UDP-N-acetylmuramate dehydrogenase
MRVLVDRQLAVQEDVPLKPLTTFTIGGSARWFAEVDSEQGLRDALAEAERLHTRCAIFAGGSNVLIADEGYDGMMIRIVGGRARVGGEHVFVDAGCNLEETIRMSAKYGLSGWERLAGIPGTIGGAIRGNAGAFGVEMKDVVVGARALNTKTGEVRSFANTQCGFSYRHSFFKRRTEWIITSAVIVLVPDERGKIEARIEETIAERNLRHIQNIKAGGSFFINPIVPTALCLLFEHQKGVPARGRRVPAGWLMDRAGMKGVRVGDALASEAHANYIVNAGDATAADVRALARYVKERVCAENGVMLEEEVTQLGFE